jgi:hypothetical protein
MNSVAADKAACEAVISLGSASACNEVMKASDSDSPACAYSAASYHGACTHVPESAGKRNQCESVYSFGSNCQFKAADGTGVAATCAVATGVAAACTSEKDAKLVQKLGQLQPFLAVFPRMHGPTWIFWANLTPFSLSAVDDAISMPDTCPTADCTFTAAAESIADVNAARTACTDTTSSGEPCVYAAATMVSNSGVWTYGTTASCTMDPSVMCETHPDALERDEAKCPSHSCTFTATTASCSECAAGKYTGEEGLAECADCEVRHLQFAIFHQYHA